MDVALQHLIGKILQNNDRKEKEATVGYVKVPLSNPLLSNPTIPYPGALKDNVQLFYKLKEYPLGKLKQFKF